MPNFVKFKLKDLDKYIYVNPDYVFSVTPVSNDCNATYINSCGDDENYVIVAENCESVVSRLKSNSVYGYENKINL